MVDAPLTYFTIVDQHEIAKSKGFKFGKFVDARNNFFSYFSSGEKQSLFISHARMAARNMSSAAM